MVIAAKHFDPVLGIDIHIIQPPGPVPPVPIPHPAVGILIDPMDYAPFIGATVMINGVPRAQAGTAGSMIPPHIPIGGVFVKPPANEFEVFMGSSTVAVDGDAQSHLGLPALSCSDIGIPGPPRPKGSPPKSLVLPTSVVLAVPMGPPVLIGGPPTISLMALGMRAAMAGLGKAFKKLKKMQKGSRRWKAIADRMHKAADDVMDKLGVGAGKARNRVHRAICSVTGHPVDVATGKVFTEELEFEIRGAIPFVFERVWFSTSTHEGPLGHGWHHSYDLELAVGKQVTGVRMADGRVALFPLLARGASYFNPDERLTLVRDAHGYGLIDDDGIEHRFASRGGDNLSLIEIRDPNGNRLVFGHDGQGRITAAQDAEGRRFRFDLDDHGRIVAIVGPHPVDEHAEQALVRYAYSPEGDLVTAADAVGAPIRYEYRHHLLVAEHRRSGLTFEFAWDGVGPLARCVHTRGTNGLYEVRLAYDDDTRTTRATDAWGTMVYRWTPMGVVEEEIDPLGESWHFEYDDAANLVLEQDPLGNTVTREYDGDNNLIAETDEAGSKTTWTYDDAHRPLTRTDPDGSTTTWAYDGRGNLVAQTDAIGQTRKFVVDARGRVIDQIDPAGNVIRWTHRDDGRELCSVDALGLRRRVQYDRLGRALQIEDGEGVLSNEYRDANGRLVGVRFPKGITEQWELDAEGNVARHWRRQRAVTEQWFGTHRNVPTARRDGLGRGEAFRYDFKENQIAHSDRKGRVIERTIGVNGRLEATRWWDGRGFEFENDARSRATAVVDHTGARTEFQLDPRGYAEKITYADAFEKSLSFDPCGRIATIVTPEHTIEREFDALGRVVVERQDDHELRFAYDHDGKLSDRWVEGSHTRFVRDARGRVVELQVDGRSVCQLGYDARNHLQTRRFEDGVYEVRGHDEAGQLVGQRVRGGSTMASVVVDRRYEWDADGRLAARIDSNRATLRFGYDAISRLTSVERAGQRTDVEYDAEDNILDGLGAARYDPFDRLVHAAGAEQRYDDLGRLSERERPVDGGLERTSYLWDARNQLSAVEVRGPDGSIARSEYEYDGLGRRVIKRAGGVETRFLWDGPTMVAEVRDGVLIQYLQNGDLGPLWARAEGPVGGPAEHFAHVVCDQIGAPLELVDKQGNVLWSAEYSVWGALVRESGELEFNHRLPGQYHDRETGLHYNFSRYYDPSCARFISPDPAGEAAGTNVYAYTCNPLLEFDPWGLAVTWYDTDGNPVPANTSGAYRYETDAQGRTIKAEGPVSRRGHDTRVATIDPPGKRAVDQNGHLLAHTNGGPTVPENFVAQNGTVNNGRYKSAEGFAREADKAGHNVTMRAEPKYRGNSPRPSGIDLVVTVDGVEYRNPRTSDFTQGRMRKRRARIKNPCR